MATVPTEVVSCGGFPPGTYDRYVLGLLSVAERARVDEQIERDCPQCIKGVQRSMNLWLVFANSLEEKEPAADFRGRLARIAELSNRVLTIPKRHRRVREPAILISSLVMISVVVLTLMAFTWIAGGQSADMNRERRDHELQQLTSELTITQVDLKQAQEKNAELLSKHSDPTALAGQKDLQDRLSKSQAIAQQYRLIIDRQNKLNVDDTTLVASLASSGVKLLPLKNVEGTPAVAYALVGNGLITLVVSKLPKIPDPLKAAPRKAYQLWLARKDEAPLVSGGVFNTREDEHGILTYKDDNELIADMTALIVTEEPADGSSVPTGPHIFETASSAQ